MLHKIACTFKGIALIANIIVIIAMFATGFGGFANPVSNNYIAVLTLSFPIFLALNILFAIFWMIFKFKYALIPLAGLIMCYMPIRDYCPMNISSETPDDAIKIISYNICNFREYDYAEGEENPTITYLEECDADIICLQETTYGNRIGKLLNKKLARMYPHQDFEAKKGNGIAIMSRFPIISSEEIDYVSGANLSRAWKLNVNGDTVIVINNHLESNKLSSDDRERFKKLVKENVNDNNVKNDAKWLIDKLASAAKIRAPQADSVAKYIEKNKHESMIVCGDFNDSPLSYSNRKIRKNLTDCFIEEGNGPGISYHTGGFYVRIDNLMCSSDWDVFGCIIDTKISASDHYPICSWLKKRHKTEKKDNKSL